MINRIAKKMLVLVALVTFLPTAGWTMPPGEECRKGGAGKHGCFKGGERHLDRLVTDLQLTDTQHEQVRTILAAEREESKSLREKMHQERTGLRASIHSGTAQEADIRAQVAVQADTKAELMIRRAAMWNEIDALLTPEQRELEAKRVESRSSGGKGCINRCCEGGGKTQR